MRRRALLASLPVSLGLAGCLGGPGSQDTDPPSRTPAAGQQANVIVRPAIGYRHGDDSYAVDPPENAQFAFVEPAGYEGDASAAAFTLELGSREFSPRTGVSGNGVHMPDVSEVYGDHGPSGSLVFDLPPVEADEGALVGDGTRYPLPDESLTTFATAPELAVQSVSVPETVGSDESVDVAVTVLNDGRRAGEFFAAVRWNFSIQGFIEATVPAGETVTAEESFGHDIDDGSLYLSITHADTSSDESFEVTFGSESE